jgi:hypothetical protein
MESFTSNVAVQDRMIPRRPSDDYYQTAAEPTAKPATPLDRLLSALSLLENATQMTLSTTDALCGSQPAEANSKALSEPAPSGLFGAINCQRSASSAWPTRSTTA